MSVRVGYCFQFPDALRPSMASKCSKSSQYSNALGALWVMIGVQHGKIRLLDLESWIQVPHSSNAPGGPFSVALADSGSCLRLIAAAHGGLLRLCLLCLLLLSFCLSLPRPPATAAVAPLILPVFLARRLLAAPLGGCTVLPPSGGAF